MTDVNFNLTGHADVMAYYRDGVLLCNAEVNYTLTEVLNGKTIRVVDAGKGPVLKHIEATNTVEGSEFIVDVS